MFQVQLLLSQPISALADDILDSGSDVSARGTPAARSQQQTPVNPSGSRQQTPVNSTAPFSKPARTKKPANGTSRENLNASTSSSLAQQQQKNNLSSRKHRSDSIDSSDLDIENFIPPEAMSPLTIGSHSSPVRDVTAAGQNRALSPGELSSSGQQGHVIARTTSSAEQPQDEFSSDEELELQAALAKQLSTSSRSLRELQQQQHQQQQQQTTSGRANATPSRGLYNNLQPGEQYDLRLVKVNNSFGLNIAVSHVRM